jgi:hypothetical protein
MHWSGEKDDRRGWVKAPPIVESEIRAVWQEDEMPQEVTSSPGYLPFTLGQDSQAWVDSMSEVVDGGNAVYGRPRPVAPPVRRQLAIPPPPSPAPPSQRSSRPGQVAHQPPPSPVKRKPPPMPEVGDEAAGAQTRQRTLPKRVLMPEIGEQPSSRTTPPNAGGGSARTSTPPRMPDIDQGPAHPSHGASMPDIGDAPPQPPAPPAMPDIGEDSSERSHRPRMPDIGE